MISASSTRKLASGHSMPVIGYGTYETTPEITSSVVSQALASGYNLIDTAAFYANERSCGHAITHSTTPRSQIFLTTKLAPNKMGRDAAAAAINASLHELGLEYIDLYLIHAPFGNPETRNGSWEALAQAVVEGKVRSIGVSNYGVRHLEELERFRETLPEKLRSVPISVAQYELHPWMGRGEIVKYAAEHNIVLQAFGPVVVGKKAEDSTLKAIAAKHGKTWAQVLVRWSLQKGFTPLPKSVTEERIRENVDVFDFELDGEDLERLEFPGAYELNRGHWDPVSWGFEGPGSKP
ncbi:hypothetical protein M409DRAFT_67031 [Zasmidium cellare ATCC 36951]|uniref:NADP-dependent oxidoreductase domain-containing protein n=1 Tax=Zasmidium cellare ATCC 36951 TaxID=1080233 RepID=A0A6A6CJN6_ZASCE|nr:uncharacterized protein M409DRAFT_67031 [Zasmidium cellare ATCC 36951]KAF2165636.1 hypothetical protein M409DRAFT_67031 [Zasmidium cellare ATCC 36951]